MNEEFDEVEARIKKVEEGTAAMGARLRWMRLKSAAPSILLGVVAVMIGVAGYSFGRSSVDAGPAECTFKMEAWKQRSCGSEFRIIACGKPYRIAAFPHVEGGYSVLTFPDTDDYRDDFERESRRVELDNCGAVLESGDVD